MMCSRYGSSGYSPNCCLATAEGCATETHREPSLMSVSSDCSRFVSDKGCDASADRSVAELSTPFPISSVLFLMAMRHCTDVPCADLSHTLCIEIGGAMTADTPPQQIKEAA